MSASELLDELGERLERLPPLERERFFDGIAALELRFGRRELATAPRPLPWPDIHARHRRIFGDEVLPENIVLAARAEDHC